ncbi:MAG: hypothetical protein NT001_00325, partial [Candidatus Woesearchaeota archaeon]|nr:hypothetical protein [Candidatus Woesearchaeota archaeon]
MNPKISYIFKSCGTRVLFLDPAIKEDIKAFAFSPTNNDCIIYYYIVIKYRKVYILGDINPGMVEMYYSWMSSK